MFKDELIRAAIKPSGRRSLKEAISINFNALNEDLLRISDFCLRQRGWGGTGCFAIAIADGVRNACDDDHAVGC